MRVREKHLAVSQMYTAKAASLCRLCTLGVLSCTKDTQEEGGVSIYSMGVGKVKLSSSTQYVSLIF